MSTPDDQDTVDTLDTLTPEERAAIGGDEYGDEDREIIKKIAGEASDDDADEDDDDDDGDDESAAPQEGKAAEPPAADDEPADEPVQAAVVPRYEAQLPSDYDDQIRALKERDAELRQRFKDGEIDIDERDAGLAEIAAEREQLLIQKATAETLAKINEQNQRQAAAEYEARFIERVKADGIDYTNPRNVRLFNTMLEELTEEHGTKGRDWLWTEAHKAVLRARGIQRQASADPVTEAARSRKPPVDAAPKTLAQVPGSDGPGDVGDEFADVLALDGTDFEDAIARMSPAQREKFLRGR